MRWTDNEGRRHALVDLRPEPERPFRSILSDAWKYVLSLVGLAMVACGGVGPIETPGHCGFWKERQVVEGRPNQCVWLFASEELSISDGSCPESGNHCAILMPEDEATVWLELPSDSLEDWTVTVAYDLSIDGSCPVTCAAEYGCEPIAERPEACRPCTAEAPC